MLKVWLLLTVSILCDGKIMPWRITKPFNVTNEDLKKIDYCALHCDLDRHSGCYCKLRGEREEMLDNITGFRQSVLDLHNYYRNLIASGSETRKGLKSAADMMYANYDLQLEYISRCFARYRYVGGIDVCKPRYKGGHSVISIEGSRKSKFHHLTMIKKWYNEMENLKNVGVIQKYKASAETYRMMRFIQMIWSVSDLMACTRIVHPKPWKLFIPKPSWIFEVHLICYYASVFDEVGSLRDGAPIYEEGPPCSKCPMNYKCESKQYPALCGPVFPIPTEPPFPFDAANAIKGKFFLLTMSFLFLII